MPDSNPESRPSAAGLLKDLKDTFGGLSKVNWLSGTDSTKPASVAPVPAEDPSNAKKVEEVVVLAPEQVSSVSASDEDAAPDWLTPLAEETMVHPPAAPTVVGLHLPEEQVAEPPEIPDWLSMKAPKDSDLPTLVGSPPVSAAEAPAISAVSELTAAVEPSAVPVAPESVEIKVEVDPFAANKELNGYMETIRQALETLASGTALNPDQEKQAKIAAGKANTLLPKLPADVLQSVILMKAVSSNNPKYGRHDFQREMLAVVDIIKRGVAKIA